ncbi:MAG: hypothetical protein K8J08_19950 [Thermoanaerobaculia bacterium]|nr:hypothetical protein [Thermoanaerobaculia bacterium]
MSPEPATAIDPSAPDRSAPYRTAEGLFGALRSLSPLRIISVCGPSVFEAIENFGAFGIHDGWMNAMCDRYHWHLQIDRIGSITSRDTIHERSGRRVLFLELREKLDAEPFLLLYLHRAKGEDFEEERLVLFEKLHALYGAGAPLEVAS